jgi:hypothetical protein
MGNQGSTLNMGGILLEGDYLQSDDGRYSLVLGADGNVSLYWRWIASGGFGYRVWQSGNSDQGPHFLIMQNDGNLCCYAGIPSDYGPLKWQCGVAPGPGPAYRAVMQTDGNFCLYPNALGQATWCTGCALHLKGAVSISTAAGSSPMLVLASVPPTGGPSDALSMQNPNWRQDRRQQFNQLDVVINNTPAGLLLASVDNGLLVSAQPQEFSLVKFTDQISLDSILIKVDNGESILPKDWVGIRPLSGDNNHFNVPGDGPYSAGSNVIMYHWTFCGNTGPCANLLWKFESVGVGAADVVGV